MGMIRKSALRYKQSFALFTQGTFLIVPRGTKNHSGTFINRTNLQSEIYSKDFEWR